MDSETVGGLLVAVLGGAGIYKAFLAGRAEQERQDAVWSAAATRVRGELSITKGSFFRATQRSITLRTGDTRILVDTTMRGKVEYTRVTGGPVEGLRDLELRIEPRSAVGLGRFSKALRLAEVETRYESFDRQMVVQGSPPALVREMLDARLSNYILDVGEGFAITDACVVIAREGLPQDPAPIATMVSFVERIMARWMAMVEAPRAVAKALDLERVDHEPGIVARGLRRGRQVTLEVRTGEEMLSTVVSFDALSGERVEIAREGIEDIDCDELASALDAELEEDHAAGAYR